MKVPTAAFAIALASLLAAGCTDTTGPTGQPHDAAVRDTAPTEVQRLASPSAWWQSEYHDLLDRVRQQKDGALHFRVRTGPRGEDEVRVALKHTGEVGLELQLDIPGAALVSVDEETGESSPVAGRVRMGLLDEDGDGQPDAWEPPADAAVEGRQLRADGLVSLRASPNEEGLYALWEMYVGVAVNRVLHDRDSAGPPEVVISP